MAGKPKIVTDERILEALENKPDKQTKEELSIELGFSNASGLSNRMTRMKIKIRDRAGEILTKKAIDACNDLVQQSKAGKTEASKTILEIAGTYLNKQELHLKGELDIGIQRMNIPFKKPIGAKVEEQKEKDK